MRIGGAGDEKTGERGLSTEIRDDKYVTSEVHPQGVDMSLDELPERRSGVRACIRHTLSAEAVYGVASGTRKPRGFRQFLFPGKGSLAVVFGWFSLIVFRSKSTR